jgi:two-component system, OmpR family, sensor kinase
MGLNATYRLPIRSVILRGTLGALACSLLVWCIGALVLGHSFLWSSQEWRTIAQVRMIWTEEEPTDPRHRGGLPYPDRVDIRARVHALSASGNFVRILNLEGKPLAQTPGPELVPLPDQPKLAEALAPFGASHRHATYQYDADERNWMVLLQPIKRGGKDVAVLQFCAVWRQPREVTRALIGYVIVAATLASVISVLFALALANWLSRPIRLLHETTVRFQQGDLKARTGLADEMSRNEVVQVSAAFDRMADHIEQSLSAQRRFVADASHELKTPLTAIGGMADMLKVGQEPEKQQKAINIILRETDRMSRLVRDLLTLSKAEHAPTEPGIGRFDLGRIVRETAEVVTLANPERNVQVEANEELHLFGNPDELGRLVLNLLENALQHTPPGTPVRVSCRKAEKGIMLEVSDQGPGIEKRDLPHLFERFYRPDSSRARKTGGSGLGLAIVKSIATRHGGRVQVVSEVGKGSVFQVLFRVQQG